MARKRKRKPPNLTVKEIAEELGQPIVAYNDAGGLCHCALCDWTKQATTIEQVEHYIARHMALDHQINITKRYNQNSGRLIDIPCTTPRPPE